MAFQPWLFLLHGLILDIMSQTQWERGFFNFFSSENGKVAFFYSATQDKELGYPGGY